jgi:hypothetical protein
MLIRTWPFTVPVPSCADGACVSKEVRKTVSVKELVKGSKDGLRSVLHMIPRIKILSH